MKFKFFNLGKIKEAEIEFNDFTLIVGDNSLGKTFLLESYTLFNNLVKEKAQEFKLSNFIKNVYIEELENVMEHLNVFNFHKTGNITLDIKYNFNDKEILKQFLKKLEGEFLNILKEKILQNPNAKTKVEIEFKNIDIKKLPEKINITTDDRILIFSTQYSKYRYNMKFPLELVRNNPEIIDFIKKHVIEAITEFISTTLLYEICDRDNIILFPSERNIYKANALRKSSDFLKESYSQIEKDPDMRYSETLFISNYLKYLEWVMVRDDKPYTDNSYVLYKELCDMLGGKPHFKEGIVDYLECEDGKIPVNLLSTKQSRLLPYFMLCMPSNTTESVILEEPEAHMSLKSMFELVEVIDILKGMCNKIIMTSHSDVFVSLLNNHIKLNGIKANIYELLESSDGVYLKQVSPSEYGYELSFMSNQIERLNLETMKAFESEYNESE